MRHVPQRVGSRAGENGVDASRMSPRCCVVQHFLVIRSYSLARVYDYNDRLHHPSTEIAPRLLFLEHARNVGRAYQNEGLELISICELLSRIAQPKFAHEDAELSK